MKRIDYPNDCLRIQSVCLEKGYWMDIPECKEVWENYSSDLAAGWLFLPKKDCDLWEQIEEYVLKRRIE